MQLHTTPVVICNSLAQSDTTNSKQYQKTAYGIIPKALDGQISCQMPQWGYNAPDRGLFALLANIVVLTLMLAMFVLMTLLSVT